VGDAKLVARVAAATLPAQPFAVEQVRAGEFGADRGALKTLDGRTVEEVANILTSWSRNCSAFTG
jgi:hypothetical protein